MSYLRWGEVLPSGKRSNSYVFGDPDSLINMDNGNSLPYGELRKLLNGKNKDKIKKSIEDGLDLHGEELGVVCERLFSEREEGKWG